LAQYTAIIASSNLWNDQAGIQVNNDRIRDMKDTQESAE
jgi:hypothetical protein